MQTQIRHIVPQASSHVYLDKNVPRWFAVYVPFRREKSAVERLERRGIESYIPLLNKTKRYGRKIKNTELPLIHHYIFVRIVESEYLKVLQERDVIDFLRFSGKLIAIPEEEINTLRKVVGDQSVEIHEMPDDVVLNRHVEIIHGQLTGLRGKVVDIESKKHFVVQLQSLGLAFRLKVPPQYLSPIEKNK